MNRKLLPAVAAFLILAMLFGSTPFSYAVTTSVTFGPQLVVTTIAQDDQVRETGIIILGLPFPVGSANSVCTTDPTKAVLSYTNPSPLPLCTPQDLMSQHKLLITYNGQTLKWRIGDTGSGVPVVTCNVLEKDKTNVVTDKLGKGKQGSWENLETTLVDVSDKFVCKPRWKSPAEGWYESVGVLDVYYAGPFDAHWIADNILTVEASLAIGRTVIFGSDIQDICVLAWPFWFPTNGITIFKPEYWATVDNDHYLNWVTQTHHVFQNALGIFTSCEDLALIQRDLYGVPLATGPDPLAPA